MFKRLPILMNETEDDGEESPGFDWLEAVPSQDSPPDTPAEELHDASPESVAPSVPASPQITPDQPKAAVVAAPVPAPAVSQAPEPSAPPVASTEQAVAPAPTPAAPSKEQIAEWRGKMLEQLRTQYALTPDQVSLMLTEPEKVLPNLFAEAQLRAMEQLAPAILQRVPQVIEQLTHAQRNATTVAEKFVNRWPELKPVLDADPQRTGVIGQFVNAYRQVNPKATTEELIEKVGAMAMVHFQVQPGTPQNQPSSAVPKQQPFVPAGQATPRSAPAPSNIFTELAMSVDVDDD